MKLGKFRFGGVHPNDSKDASSVHSSVLPSCSGVLLTSLQHAGAPAKIIKQRGDIVNRGDLIAEASGAISANVHASISGKVTSIEIAPPPMGRSVSACLIQSDNSGLQNVSYEENKSYTSYPPELLISKIRTAGIVGLGGAMFPTDAKISLAAKLNCDVLIVNGVECEPYITSDYRLMLESTAEIFKAIDIVRRAIPSIKKTVIGIEGNKPVAITEMEKMAKDYNAEVMTLKTKYPQGGEKMLIDATTSRVVPIGKFPTDVGVIVLNIATLYAIYEAVAKDKPLIERLVTVAGDGVKEMKNVWTPLGTRLSDLVEYCGGLTSDSVAVIAGGPMMGFALPNLEQCVVKGNNAILVFDTKNKKTEKEYACIRCGRCYEVCPVRLAPSEIAHSAKFANKSKMEKLDIMNCFECGACSYICSSKIPLVQWIRVGKDAIRRQL